MAMGRGWAWEAPSPSCTLLGGFVKGLRSMGLCGVTVIGVTIIGDPETREVAVSSNVVLMALYVSPRAKSFVSDQ